MQTAITVQLLEKNVLISPMTNIETLYYEVEDKDEYGNGIIYRHLVLPHFPVYVNYNNASMAAIQVVTDNDAPNKAFAINTPTDVIRDSHNNDIYLSQVRTRIIPGTNIYAMDISNYNMTLVLSSYAGLGYVESKLIEIKDNIDASIAKNKQYLNNINVSTAIKYSELDYEIQNTSNYVYNVLDSSIAYINKAIYSSADPMSEQELYNLIAAKLLVPGTVYTVKYSAAEFKNNTNKNLFDIVLRANSSCGFEEESVGCIKNNSTNQILLQLQLNRWVIKGKFIPNEGGHCFSITYMKDDHNNEAEFDFKNYKIGSQPGRYVLGLFNYSDGTILNNYNNIKFFGDKTKSYISCHSDVSCNNINIGKNVSAIILAQEAITDVMICENSSILLTSNLSTNTMSNINIGANVNGYIENSNNITVKDNCKSINILNSSNIIIGNDSNDVSINNCSNITTGNTLYNSTISNGENIIVGNNCSEIIIANMSASNITMGDNEISISINNGANNIVIGDDYNNLSLTDYTSDTCYTYTNIVAREIRIF